MADRLGPDGAREPTAGLARQTGDVSNPQSRQPTDPHADHDLELVAAFAAGDLDGSRALQVERLLSACAVCALLVTDLRSIATATRQLPPAAGVTGLDFRLTPTVAARLSRGRRWRRLLAPFGSQGSVARPLSLAFTTLGLAGLLFATLPLMSGFGFGSGAAAPQAASSRYSSAANGGVDTSPGRAATNDGQASLPTQSKAAATPDTALGALTPGSAAPTPQAFDVATAGPSTKESVADAGQFAPAVPPGDDGPTPLVLLSIGFLAAGVGLYVMRRLATRLR